MLEFSSIRTDGAVVVNWFTSFVRVLFDKSEFNYIGFFSFLDRKYINEARC